MADKPKRVIVRRECERCGSHTTPDNKVLKTTSTHYLLLCAKCIVKKYGGVETFRSVRELAWGAKEPAKYKPCEHRRHFLYACELDEDTYKCQWCWGAEEDENNPWPDDAIEYLQYESSKP